MNAPTRREFTWRREAIRFLDFAALTGFAVAEPVFDVLSGATDYLVFRQVEPLQIVALVFALVVVPPLVLLLVELSFRFLFPGVGTSPHTVLVGLMLTLIAVQPLNSVGSWGPFGGLVAAIGVGVGLSKVYARWQPAQLWMRLASPAPVVFAALFLFASPVAGVLQPSHSAPGGEVGSEHHSPVVLMVFDELPTMSLLADDGEIDERLYPNLAALARDATFFRNATSVAARTVHSVPAILTGRLPRDNVAPTNAEYSENLFSLLRSSHDVRALEAVTSLCPKGLCSAGDRGRRGRWHLLGDALRVWVHTVATGRSGPDPLGAWFTEETAETGTEPARFQQFLASIDGEGNPFHFLHLLLPHAPWSYLPDGLQYTPRDLGMVSYDERTDHPWPALVNHQRHLLQAMYVDGLLGQTIERLKDVGLYERSTLLVTADHGIGFEPGLSQGTRSLQLENEHAIAWVPFLLKSPNQTTGTTTDDNVMTIDIAPTLAQLSGSHLSWEVDGMSLTNGDPRDAATKVFFNEPGVAMTIDGRRAYPKVVAGAVHGLARPDEGAEGMFKVGPYPEMIGTTPSSYAVVDQPDAVGRVEDLWSYDDIDKESGRIPALVSGHLALLPDTTPPVGVAVALNGTIAAVSGVYEEGDQAHRFATMVSPRWMQRGANALELLLVYENGDGPALRRVEVDGV